MIPLAAWGLWVAGGAVVGAATTYLSGRKKRLQKEKEQAIHNKHIEEVLDEILLRQKEHEEDLEISDSGSQQQTTEMEAFGIESTETTTSDVERILKKVRRIKKNTVSRFDLMDLS